MTTAIRVRGAGVVCALGCGTAAVRSALRADPGATGYRRPSEGRPPFAAPFDPAADLPDGLGRRMGRQPALALAAILEAVGDRRDLRDAALVLGTAHGAVAETVEFIFGAARHGARLASPLQFAGSVHNAMTGAPSRVLGVHGPALTISNGDSSFEAALGVAVRMLRTGRVARAIVGGSDAWHPLFGRALRRLGLESDPGAPWSDRAPPPGFVQGEGAGAILLEAVPSRGEGVYLEDAILGPGAPGASLPLAEVQLLATGGARDGEVHRAEWERVRPRTGPASPEPRYPAALFGSFASLSAVAACWEAARRLGGEGRGGATLLLNVPQDASRGVVVLAGSG